MKTLNNVIIFSDDDEALDFCITQNPVIKTLGETGISYFDYDYTNEYKKALADGYGFNVEGTSSLMKRGCLCRGTVSKPIENLININLDEL